MTKENDNNAQPSSFRDQILRELEELKAQRLEGQPEETLSQVNDKVVEEIEAIASVAKNEIDHSEVAEYEPEELPKVLEERADESISEEITVLDEKQTDSNVGDQPQPVLQDTVERNLEELRNFISANPELLGDQLLESEKMGSASVQSEGSFDAHSTSPSLEDTFIDFPKEDVSTVTGDTEIIPLEATLIAPSVAVSKEPIKVEESQPRRRTHSKNKQKRKKQDRTAKRIVAVVMSLVVVFFLATCTFGFFWVKSSLEPINTEATKTIQVEIPEGSSTKEIANILFENDLIKNATVFNYYSKIKSYNNYQSGFYNLSQSMSVDDLAKALQESGTPTAQEEPAGKVLIVEGYTLTQIANSVTLNAKTDDKTDKTPFTSEEFLATVTNQEFIDRMVATYPNLFASLPAADSGVIYRLEGYLFPAVYDYYDDATIEDLVEQMISTTDARLQPYYEAIANKNLTVNEVLTLASLVEKEGSTDEDRRNIASVFFNRLNAEMPLQSNIAILYAQGKLGEETTLAEDTNIDTSIESPYNIYWRAGLMPGPVDSPSLSAIEAVLNANATDYYYFVADVTTGTVYFANTIEEHDQNVATYVNAHLE
ncbi:endolytic transglycosylase MltG [Streptococcus suis]|uniref:Endolytic murein transglycosylase n=1 Tax=Streptococcus suis TaxID=1307 RepID=A0A9X4RPH9_STRSU|nr:endolytic transglycosylase MltG [Streptococcus parasuis]MDG4512287.1 endolytic transglycosylase MltG [Streptococcus suis]MDG4524232.1 endolytic transglycosylase MltG [Streptococcus suis]QWV87261.1 endolytic transglycosylase MltG [Streptococcus parasuis]ULL20580.1 endolytic transglycosylase MltG [Streptococcus suis]WFB92436.1 endolytic transglycosylase MltG [Streptococcus parasuis]